MSLFVYVIDFYIEMMVAQKTDNIQTSKFGSIFVFTCAGFLSLIWNHPHVVIVIDKIKKVIDEEHALSAGVVMAYFLYIIGKNFIRLFDMIFLN